MRWEKAVFRPLHHLILLAALPAVSALAAEGGAQPVSFRSEIAPLLQRRCAACHCEENARPVGQRRGRGCVAWVRIRYLCDLPEVVLSIAFNRDGDTLVAGCGDRTMRIFDASSGKQKRVLRQHADWVQAVAFNPKGSRLVSVSRDRTARVFDTATWEFNATYQGHDTPVLAATFTADGSRIYTASRNGATYGTRSRRTSAATSSNSAATCGSSQPAHSALPPDAATAQCASTKATANSRGSRLPVTATPCSHSLWHRAANGSPAAAQTAK
jgi:WD40 repeat protein